jgi:hypothetical protein
VGAETVGEGPLCSVVATLDRPFVVLSPCLHIIPSLEKRRGVFVRCPRCAAQHVSDVDAVAAAIERLPPGALGPVAEALARRAPGLVRLAS